MCACLGPRTRLPCIAGAVPARLNPTWTCRGLGDNALTGSLPPSWGQGPAFPSLQTLDLSASGVSGSLPPVWGADGGFAQLSELTLESMRLSGGLPPAWASPGRFSKLQGL